MNDSSDFILKDVPYWTLDGHIPRKCKDVHEWGKMMEGKDRIVKQEDISDVHISTVFLGIDHNFFGGPPVLFETMIFGGPHDEYQERYCTWEEAEAGHARAVELVKSKSKIL